MSVTRIKIYRHPNWLSLSLSPNPRYRQSLNPSGYFKPLHIAHAFPGTKVFQNSRQVMLSVTQGMTLLSQPLLKTGLLKIQDDVRFVNILSNWHAKQDCSRVFFHDEELMVKTRIGFLSCLWQDPSCVGSRYQKQLCTAHGTRRQNKCLSANMFAAAAPALADASWPLTSSSCATELSVMMEILPFPSRGLLSTWNVACVTHELDF